MGDIYMDGNRHVVMETNTNRVCTNKKHTSTYMFFGRLFLQRNN